MDGSLIDHGARAHARLSPSGAARWMACPGSVRLSEGIPDRSSPYAEEGTRAHEMAETALRHRVLASRMIAESATGDAREMAHHVDAYVSYVLDLIERADYVAVEQRVSAASYVPGIHGTADALVVTDGGRELHVVDLKYGRGVEVFAENNPQLMVYALAALDLLDMAYPIERVVLTVAMVRKGYIDDHAADADALRHWGVHTLAPAAEETLDPDAPLVPGEAQCRWCPAKDACPALAGAALAEDTPAAVAARTDMIPPSEMPALLDRVALIRMWADAVEARAAATIRSGVPIGGWKMVAGRSRRQWADPDAAIKAMRGKGHKLDEIAPRKPIPIGAAEKIFGRDLPKSIADAIGHTDPAPALVRADDRRPALTFNPGAGFEPTQPEQENTQ